MQITVIPNSWTEFGGKILIGHPFCVNGRREKKKKQKTPSVSYSRNSINICCLDSFLPLKNKQTKKTILLLKADYSFNN